MNEQMRKLRKEMQRALNEERAKQTEEGEWTEYDRGLADGWVEALEYVLGQIDAVSNTGEPIVTIPISEYDIELFEQLVRVGGSFSWKFDGVDVTFVKQEGEEE